MNALQFRRLALKSPPLGPKWDRWAKKLGCASHPPIPADCRLEDRMRTRVFSPTYPTWALVRGTSRPAGETVSLHCTSSLRVDRNTPFLTRMETPVPVCRVQCLTSGSNYHRLMAASHRLTITANMDLVTACYCVVCDNSDNIAT